MKPLRLLLAVTLLVVAFTAPVQATEISASQKIQNFIALQVPKIDGIRIWVHREEYEAKNGELLIMARYEHPKVLAVRLTIIDNYGCDVYMLIDFGMTGRFDNFLFFHNGKETKFDPVIQNEYMNHTINNVLHLLKKVRGEDGDLGSRREAPNL